MPRYAAIDIGSNSVRLLVAEIGADGQMKVLADERTVIRLGESVFRQGFLSAEALDDLTAVLVRMATIIRQHDLDGMRVVATSAVRDASNQQEFRDRVASAIGAPVEIISGLEEARLIHLGVQARWPGLKQRALIIDVGGGSAEIILSEGQALKAAFSKPLGAVRLKEVFLQHDPPQAVELRRLEEYIAEKVRPALERIGTAPFERAIGTSATAAALVCAIHRIPRARREQADRLKVTRQQVRRLYLDLSGKDLAQRRKQVGVGPRRAEIIVPGVAVFDRVMEMFRLPSLFYSTAGVRDGVIADLAQRRVGRERSLLDREQRRVVEQMARRYGVSVPHARQVAALAHRLFEILQPLHKLPPPAGRLLEAAAYLHDIGHYISDSAHHKHSAYIVANSPMPGFTVAERHLIAMLCRFHRKSMPAGKHEAVQDMTPEDRRTLLYLVPLLRLADSLDRSHSQLIQQVDCECRNGAVALRVTAGAGVDLDLWAAERVADVFRQVYGCELTLRSERGSP
ncbi:MAG: Ppx/GppA family phosphatase [Bryobacteraceae bacterium]|nr:Ppx/GppA family phosphatase [Bryobacteraceae bacterium]MDW8378785.1 Ppx/GppA phosphatase family protein [Bryobacterales bacterium]